MGEIIIREISATDYPILETFLYNAIFLHPGMEEPPREVIFQPQIYIHIKDFGSKNDCGVIAEKGCKIIGAAWTRIIHAYGHIDNDTPELAISVLPEQRGQGIGTMLMNRLFCLLSERGYKRTSLSVQKDNPAVRFYKRLGYEITEEKSDDYIMVRELGVSLREGQITDATDLVGAINNKKVQDNLRGGLLFPYTEKDAREFTNVTLTAEKDVCTLLP